MSKMQYDMAALRRAEERRQKVIDLLNATPGMNALQLLEAMPEYTLANLRGAIANMLARGEIAASGPRRAHVFFAIVKTTHSADSVRAAKLARNHSGNARRDPAEVNAARERRRIAEAKRAQRKCEKELAAQPWRTVHIVRPDDPPLKNQGGQGALRRSVYVNCEQNY